MSSTGITHSTDGLFPAVKCELMSDGAKVAYFQSGDGGTPLLLIHSINAAASSAEVEPLRAHYAQRRRVYGIDLPGFGDSDRSDRQYTARLMTDAIVDLARQIRAVHGAPIDALAVSLGCEFLARAAVEHPSLFRSIALVSPTGFSGSRSFREPPGQSRGKQWVYQLLTRPGWGPWLYRQLTRPKVIRYFLKRTWGSSNIDEALWHADVRMSQYPGAHHAPLYFLAAILFSADIHDVYAAISLPVWASHGTRGDFVDYRQLEKFAAAGHWKVSVFDTGALPYFEELPAFIESYDSFLKDS